MDRSRPSCTFAEIPLKPITETAGQSQERQLLGPWSTDITVPYRGTVRPIMGGKLDNMGGLTLSI